MRTDSASAVGGRALGLSPPAPPAPTNISVLLCLGTGAAWATLDSTGSCSLEDPPTPRLLSLGRVAEREWAGERSWGLGGASVSVYGMPDTCPCMAATWLA